MVPTNQCPICATEASIRGLGALDSNYSVRCPRCGDFKITMEALEDLPKDPRMGPFGNRKRANASGWIWENQGIRVSTRDVEMLAGLRTPSFHERADKVMLHVEGETTYAGETVVIDLEKWLGRTWCLNVDELFEVLQFLHSEERLEVDQTYGTSEKEVKITPSGWAYLETLKAKNPESQQGFVAMWFDEDMRSVYDQAIKPAIEAAGYKAVRVDDLEHSGKIDDRIIAEIRRSRFVVADYTGHRGGVYYEAGFAHGLGLPVFFTCRQDQIGDLHFDVRQYNTIVWEDPDELRDRLRNRIEAVLGRGTASGSR
ncbi:hypothetical protein [Deferrisoma sp.]